MYVCQLCQEDVPDHVKKTSLLCPFCHEPWPEEAPAEAAGPGDDWGDALAVGAAPAVTDTGPVAAEETKKKSKLPLVIIVVVVLAAGGGVAFFWLGKGENSGGGSKGAASSKFSEQEFSAIDTWYREARKHIYDFMAGNCQMYHDYNYRYVSYFGVEKKVITRKGQKEEELNFKLKVAPAKGAKAKSTTVDIFGCPGKIAALHRDHPFVLTVRIEKWRDDMFSRLKTFAFFTVSGKLLSYFPPKDRRFKSIVAETREGISFPWLRRVFSSKDEELFGFFKAMTETLPSRIRGKTMHLANVQLTKIKPGKKLAGTWRLSLSDPRLFKQALVDFAASCLAMRKKITKLDKPRKHHSEFLKLTRIERKVTKDLCGALETMVGALTDEQVDAAGLKKANAQLAAAKKTWNTKIFVKMEALGKGVDNVVRGKAF